MPISHQTTFVSWPNSASNLHETSQPDQPQPFSTTDHRWFKSEVGILQYNQRSTIPSFHHNVSQMGTWGFLAHVLYYNTLFFCLVCVMDAAVLQVLHLFIIIIITLVHIMIVSAHPFLLAFSLPIHHFFISLTCLFVILLLLCTGVSFVVTSCTSILFYAFHKLLLLFVCIPITLIPQLCNLFYILSTIKIGGKTCSR